MGSATEYLLLHRWPAVNIKTDLPHRPSRCVLGLCGFIAIYPTPVRLPSFYRLCDGGIDNISYHGLFTTFAVIVACKTWWAAVAVFRRHDTRRFQVQPATIATGIPNFTAPCAFYFATHPNWLLVWELHPLFPGYGPGVTLFHSPAI